MKIYACGLCEDEYLSYVRDFVALVEDKLKDMQDVVFCIENTSGFKTYHRHAIELMLASPVFGLTFYIGHNYKASEDDESFILSHADKLRHFHIHDGTAKSNHVALGDGVLDIDRYIKKAERFDCPIVIEVKESSSLRSSLNYMNNHGFM